MFNSAMARKRRMKSNHFTVTNKQPKHHNITFMNDNRRGGELHIIQIGDVLVSPDIFTEEFCCDLDKCKGACCVEGDAGAPVTLDEIGDIEGSLDAVWEDLTASAQSIIDKQGVAYSDADGDLVTSIVGGKDCVFTCHQDLDRKSVV